MTTTVSPPATPLRPRLNPFAFPSDTSLRFALLIASVLAASLFAFGHMSAAWTGEEVDASSQCLDKVDVRPPSAAFSDAEAAQVWLARTRNALAACQQPIARAEAAWMIGGTVLLLLFAGLILWILPAWKIRRDHLLPLSAEDAPEAVAYLAGLVQETRLRKPPTFLWNPLNSAVSGLAFGRPGKHYVALSGGLVTRSYTDPAAFRAVVLHELAHLRNGDVDRAYFTVAVWRAFVIVVLVPFVAYVVRQANAYDYSPFHPMNLSIGARLLALAALVYVTRNAVLRAREVYADVRASVWDGPAGALDRILATLPRPEGSRWPALLRVHPDPARRREIVADTRGLFRLQWWEAFGVGIATTIGLASVERFLGYLQQTTGSPAAVGSGLPRTGAALLLAPLAVSVAGLIIWRAAFLAMSQGDGLHGVGRLALCLGLGMVVGEWLSFDRYVEALSASAWLHYFSYRLPWNLLILVLLTLTMHWIAGSASAWLEVAGSRRRLRLAYSACLALGSVASALWLSHVFQVRESSTSFQEAAVASQGSIAQSFIGGAQPAFLYTQTLFEQPTTVLILVSLWMFPLAAWHWRRRPGETWGADWALLDQPYGSLPLPRFSPMRPGAAVRIGLSCGAAFCVLYLVVRVVAKLTLSEAVRESDGYKIRLYFASIALAAVVQGVAVLVTASRVERLGALHGLFAALIAGCVATAGFLGFNLLFGGGASPSFVWLVFSNVVSWGALVSIVVAAVRSGVPRKR